MFAVSSFFVVRRRLKVSGKEGSIQALILFCCAKRSISPSKAETSAKRSRSFYGRNSTAQKTTKSTLAYSLLFPLVFYQAGFFILRGCINKNKASLFYVVKSLFLFSSVCQIPFRLFFRKNRLFFLKIPSLETAISCLAFWVLRMASSSFL